MKLVAKSIELNKTVLSVNGYELSLESLKDYVLNSISSEDYEGDELKTVADKLSFVVTNFNSEFCHAYNIQRFKGNYTLLFADYLQGVPTSTIDIAIYYFDMINILKSLETGNFFDDMTEDNQDDVLQNFHIVISVVLMELLRENKISIK